MKTTYILFGGAAVAGLAWWYLKNQIPQEPTPIATSTITDLSTVKKVELPSALIQPTSGNTGIVPPTISESQNSIPVQTAVQKPKSMLVQSALNMIAKAKQGELKLKALSGNDPYLFI